MPDIISRKQAKALGLKRYYTGVPCKNGHLAERYVGGHCVECDAAWSKSWHKANRSHLSKYWNDWRKTNSTRENEKLRERRKDKAVRAKHNAWNASWRQNNKDKMRVLVWRWRRKKPENYKASKHKRRSRQAVGSHTAADILDILRLQDGKCAYCSVPLDQKYQVDHIVPLALGGDNGRRNIQLLCIENACNQRKNDSDPIDFARSLGRLL